jgi:hypothetical protein
MPCRCYAPVIGIPATNCCGGVSEACGAEAVGNVEPVVSFGYATVVPPLASCDPGSFTIVDSEGGGITDSDGNPITGISL